MAVIVTGGAGFCGSHLVDRLVARGEHVIVIDNLLTGRLANLRAGIESGDVTFVYCDIGGDAEVLRAAIADAAKTERVTQIFHLASPASPEAYNANPWETLLVNGKGTMDLLQIAGEYSAGFLFASTSEVYGDPLVHPQPESYFGNVNPTGPRACYDEGKRFGEAAVCVGATRFSIDAKIVRLFNSYGPRMQVGDGRLLPSLCEALIAGRPLPLHGTGMQTRSLTFVNDVVDGILTVSASALGPTMPVNLGSEDEASVEQIARTLCEIAQVAFAAEHLPARPEDPQRRKPVVERAATIGWQPTTPLRTGLERTLTWFRTELLEYA